MLLLKKLFEILRRIALIFRFIHHDVNTHVDIPIIKRIGYLKRGFLSKSVIYYDLKENSYKNYLSDYAEIAGINKINKEYRAVLDNKLLFHSVCSQFSEFLPKMYCFISNGHLISAKTINTSRKEKFITDLIYKKKKIVIKPFIGRSGEGIYIIRNKKDAIFFNNKEVGNQKLEKYLLSLQNHLIFEYINQAEYALRIYPNASNTVRILTMWDIETGKAFIAAAVHRFGTKKSGHIDSWTKGGLCSSINLENGELGNSVYLSEDNLLIWTSHHPDTGNSIRSVRIPNWSSIKQKLLSVANSYPMIPYVGWDIIVQNNDFKIIEANNNPGLTTIQIHTPIMKDNRIIKFFTAHRVV